MQRAPVGKGTSIYQFMKVTCILQIVRVSQRQKQSIENSRKKASREMNRIIALIDLDCFYCQVEHKRLGIPKQIPLGVQQWNSLIAVNYAARDAGVKRGFSASEARKACPNIMLVHVQTIDKDGNTNDDASTQGRDRLKSKACLERYREESCKVVDIFSRFCSDLERASVDEAFLDLTTECNQSLEIPKELHWNSKVLPDIFFPSDEEERRLYHAAQLVSTIRRTVFDELGYTCSAGISFNKLGAKLVSSLQKPDGQTVFARRAIPYVQTTIPLKKFRHLGAKLGDRILECIPREKSRSNPEMTTASDALQNVPFQKLIDQLGLESALWVRNYLSLEDDEPVRLRTRVKSLVAAKSFDQVSDLESIRSWMRLLARELSMRVESDMQRNDRIPQNFALHVQHQSRVCRFPIKSFTVDIDDVIEAAMELFEKLGGKKLFPCSRLTIIANGFVDIPKKKERITSFFERSFKREKPQQTEIMEAKCEYCSMIFKAGDLQEHLDFHFASEMQEIENGRRRSMLSSAKLAPKKKKIKTIDSFFKRKV